MQRGYFGWLVLSCLVIALPAAADDWPQWRGPDRTGVSKEKGLAKVWPKAGPKSLWIFNKAGMGFSSFAVVKGVLYTLGTRGTDEIVIALDAKKGTELWTAKVGPIFDFKGNVWGEGPRSTPTIDGNFLYALGGFGDLVCVDISAKKEVWRKNLPRDFGGKMMETAGNNWGYSESPLIDGKLLICTPGGPKGTMAALDKTNGKLIWQSKNLTNNAPYSSAVVAEFHKVRQYIQLSYDNTDGKEHGVVSGFDAKNGNVLWSAKIFNQSSYAMCPTPIIYGDKVYVTTGYGGGCHLFEINAMQQAQEKFASKIFKKVKNTHGGVVRIGDYIYGHSESKTWLCQSLKTGKIEWDDRNTLSCESGAITAVGDMLYLFTDEGEVGLAKADPKPDPKTEGLSLVSSFKLPQRAKMPGMLANAAASRPWAHPVVANGVLYLRDHELIFAFDAK